MYCTKQALIDRFGESELTDLTDRQLQGAIDDAVLDQAIADAQATIDGYLGGRYQLPLTTVPPIITSLACNIARFNLYDEQAPDQVNKRYDDAIGYLKSVRDGKTSLGISDTGDKAQSADLAVIESAGSVFARDTSKGFI
ncbi:DUF1320 domain-containing protein [Pseudoalteromonas sp. CO325X]|uniref:gp436 family protein n=1 Tax=Pseudoalteromonas sp. CO325X TaxID=1777262 RepID=UPI001022BB5A|nr:phage protein Gp36 family protein [Pseudoalteromonas sp. CO325X]RZF83712.1 DUF1320 domain-containing protein [Pseudoalteromonas sp. CO325X]